MNKMKHHTDPNHVEGNPPANKRQFDFPSFPSSPLSATTGERSTASPSGIPGENDRSRIAQPESSPDPGGSSCQHGDEQQGHQGGGTHVTADVDSCEEANRPAAICPSPSSSPIQRCTVSLHFLGNFPGPLYSLLTRASAINAGLSQRPSTSNRGKSSGTNARFASVEISRKRMRSEKNSGC